MELHHVESGEWEDVYTKLRIKFSTEETDGYGVPVIEAEAESDTYSISSVMVLEEYASEWSDWSYNSIDDIYDADYDSVLTVPVMTARSIRFSWPETVLTGP